MQRPLRVASRMSSFSVQIADGDEPVVRVLALELHGDLAVGDDIGEIGERVAPDIALGGGEDDDCARLQLASSSGSGMTVEIVSPGGEWAAD